MNGPRRCLRAGMVACLLTWATPALSHDPAWKRIEVPVDRISEVWTQLNRADRPLIAVPRDEFERLLQAAQPPQPTPRSVVLESADYEATLVDETLVGGRLRLELRRFGNRPVWQRLSPWNLALSGVAWSDREAVAGTGLDGHFWLWNDRPQGELVGGWSARGKAVADHVEFHLQLPEAVSTTLRIRVPADSKLELAAGGITRRLEGGPGNTWDTWELSPADPSEFRFRVIRPPREPAANPLVSFRQQFTAEVREDHIRFQARFETEIWGGETRELQFSIPAAVELYAVSMGPESSLEWTRDSTPGPRHAVRVWLPEPTRGVVRPIILEGIFGTRATGSTVIPQVELVNGLFQSGQQTITVMRPMQLAAVRMTGCRQGAPLMTTADSETLTVEQLLPDALLTLDLRRPTSTMTAQLLSQLDLAAETWGQTSYVLWSANAGGVFQASVRLPSGWEVTDVDAFNAIRGNERISWEKVDESGGTTLLRVEFFQAVAPGQPRLLRILSRRRPIDGETAVESPLPLPLDCTLNDVVLTLQTHRRFRALLAGDTTFTEIDPEQLSDGWWQQPEWKELLADPAPTTWFRGSDVSRFGSLRLEPEPVPISCAAETIVELSSSATVQETYRLNMKPLAGPCDRVLVWLSESGPDVSWRMEAPADGQLVAKRLPSEQLSLWDLPPEGDLWELRLAAGNSHEVIVKGERARMQTMPGRAGLPFLPQAQPFSGTVELRAGVAVEVLPHGLLALSSSARSAKRRTETMQHWRQQSPQDELRWISRSTPRVESATLAQMQLRTLVSAPDELYDYHRALCLISHNLETLQFRFPANCDGLAANLNGVDLGNVSDGLVVVPPARTPGPQRLLLSYRTPSQRGFWRCARRVAVPECHDVEWTSFRWDFSLPPTARLWTEPAGVRLVRPLEQPGWTERLFGPFGRSAQESIFWPWSSAAWSNLLRTPTPTRHAASLLDSEWSPPAGWQNYVAYAPLPPDHLRFVIWRGDRIQLLAWIGLLGSVILGLGLRRRGWGFRNEASVLVLAALLATCWAADPPVTELVGSLWTGTLVAMLVPRRWLEPKLQPPAVPAEHRPVGSTRSFTLPPLGPAATTVVLLAIGLVGAAETMSLPDLSTEHAVLVPVDDDGQPSRKLPVVYVPADLLRGLREAAAQQLVSAEPTWVFERAVYRLKVGAESPAAVVAAIDVLAAGPDSTLTIPLALRGSGLSSVASCRVDGRPAVLSSRTDGSGFQVVLSRPEFPVSAIGDLPLTRHTVVVELYRPWHLEALGATIAMQIPAIHDTRVALEGAGASQSVQFSAAAGQSKPQEGRSTAVVDYGPVTELVGHWTLGTAPVRPVMANCQLESVELLAVSANALESRTRTVITPQSGTLRQLTIQLPPKAVLQELQSIPPTKYEVRHGAKEAYQLDLQFEVEQRQPVVIRCQYVIPKPSQMLDFVWQGLGWSSSEAVNWVNQRRILAIGSRSDLRVQPQSVEDSGLVPLALDGAKEWFDDVATDVRPKAVFQVNAERTIPFRCTIAPVQRRTAQWLQVGALRKDRLLWTMEAVLEPPALPVYSHVLLVDRRLQIESVSVRERDAERRLRWSESRPVGNSGANRVTVFLTDAMTQAQRLTLVASLPIAGPGTLQLPNVRLENTETAKARLDVSADSSWQLEWNSLRGLKRILKPVDATADEGATPAAPSWEFEVQDPDWRGTILLRPFDESSAIRAVYAVNHSSAESAELHARVEVPAVERSARITIDIPHPWELKALPPTAGLQVDRVSDGASSWTSLQLPSDASGPLAVRFQARAAWSAFPKDECPLPVVRGTGHPNIRVWLAEIAGPPLTPRLKSPDDGEVLNPPRWAIDWLNDLAPMSPGQRWVGLIEDELSWWPLVAADVEPESVQVTWLEQRLWRHVSQPDAGATLIRLAEPARYLTVRAPARVRVAAAIVDGRQATILSTQDRDHRISAVDGQPFQEVRVSWRSLEVASAPWSGFVETFWLTLPRAHVTQQALTIFPAANELFWPVRGWAWSDPTDRILQRLETLSDMLTDHPGHASEWTTARLRAGVTLAAKQLDLDHSAVDKHQARHRERWQTLVERVQQLPAEPKFTVDVEPPIDELLVNHPAAQYGLLELGADHTWSWRIDDRALRAVGAGILFLGAVLVLRLLLRPKLRDWLCAHPHAASGLLGLVWWLCLTPSIFGMALLAWSVYRAVTAPRGETSSEAVAA